MGRRWWAMGASLVATPEVGSHANRHPRLSGGGRNPRTPNPQGWRVNSKLKSNSRSSRSEAGTWTPIFIGVTGVEHGETVVGDGSILCRNAGGWKSRQSPPPSFRRRPESTYSQTAQGWRVNSKLKSNSRSSRSGAGTWTPIFIGVTGAGVGETGWASG